MEIVGKFNYKKCKLLKTMIYVSRKKTVYISI